MTDKQQSKSASLLKRTAPASLSRIKPRRTSLFFALRLHTLLTSIPSNKLSIIRKKNYKKPMTSCTGHHWLFVFTYITTMIEVYLMCKQQSTPEAKKRESKELFYALPQRKEAGRGAFARNLLLQQFFGSALRASLPDSWSGQPPLPCHA
ncbi:hypothetical protein [Aneurinibacillus soli]|uniref:hypothetical protein n=1 Tax=Aneurinibacillus soli TaxID=1500254 RepID=UPI001E3EE2DC|nr:hypothetical protein [Aneurinibacillus soli]